LLPFLVSLFLLVGSARVRGALLADVSCC